MKMLILIALCLLTLLWITPALAQITSIKPSQQEPLADDWKWADPNDLYHPSKCLTLNELKPVSWEQHIVTRLLEAHNAGKWDSLLASFDENVTLYLDGSADEPLLRGKVALREFFIVRMSRNPRLQCRLRDHFVIGNTLVAHEELSGGGPNTRSILTTYQLTDGRISSIRYEVQR